MFYEVIIDSGETPNKCTIAPLSSRSDFHLFRVQGTSPLAPLRAPILLHHQGECLSKLQNTLKNVEGIATIDCIWRRLDPLIRRIPGKLPLLARIPDGFETAYPRRNAKNNDPPGGLATIEAIFVAAALLGNWDPSLLSEYHFGRKFVELNTKRFLELGIHKAVHLDTIPIPPRRPRTSLQRRKDRGKRIQS